MAAGFDRGYAGDGLKGAMFLSLLLHLVAIGLLVFSPSFPSPKLTFGPVYSVSLVDSPVSGPGGGYALPVSSPSLEKELKGIKSVETAVKKSPARAVPVPVSRVENKGLREDALEKAIENIKKRAAAAEGTEQKKPVPPAPAYRGTGDAKGTAAGAPGQAKAMTGAGSGGAGFPASGGQAGGDERINSYYREIWFRIKGQWALPGGMIPKEALESVIAITILRSGAVTEVRFEKSSGNRYFDESALKAIQKAAPLPPLPEWINGRSLNLGIRFHSAELGK